MINSRFQKEFLARGIKAFHGANQCMQHLAYCRNSDKSDLIGIFSHVQGSCSTKHAVFTQLATEKRVSDLSLTLGVFKMNTSNAPRIADTLSQYALSYIPEAHTYLKYGENYFDFTRADTSSNNFINDVLCELEIRRRYTVPICGCGC